MKRIGAFIYSFIPFVLVMIIQVGVLFLLSNMMVYVKLFQSFAGNLAALDFFDDFFMDDRFNTMVMVLYSFITIVFFSLWYYSRCGGEYGRKAFRQIHPLQLLGTVFLVPGLQLMSSIVCIVIEVVLPSAMQSYEELLESAGVTDASAILLLYTVVMAPVCEELIFRGVTYRLFGRVFRSFWLANFFQALLFGIFHGNLVQGVYAFFLGLILGYVCEKGGTIYYSIFLHVLFNAWGMWMGDLLSDPALPVLFDLLLLPLMLLGPVIGVTLFHKGMHAKVRYGK